MSNLQLLMAVFEMAMHRYQNGDFIGIEDVIEAFKEQYPGEAEGLIIGFLTGLCQGQELGIEIGKAGYQL